MPQRITAKTLNSVVESVNSVLVARSLPPVRLVVSGLGTGYALDDPSRFMRLTDVYTAKEMHAFLAGMLTALDFTGQLTVASGKRGK